MLKKLLHLWRTATTYGLENNIKDLHYISFKISSSFMTNAYDLIPRRVFYEVRNGPRFLDAERKRRNGAFGNGGLEKEMKESGRASL